MAELADFTYQAASLLAEATDLRERLNIATREEKLAEVEGRAEDPSLWDDTDYAQKVMEEMSRRRNELLPWRRLASLAEDTQIDPQLRQLTVFNMP